MKKIKATKPILNMKKKKEWLNLRAVIVISRVVYDD